MKLANITMVGEILRFHKGDDKAVLTLSHKLGRGDSLFLMNDDRTAYVSYDPMFGGKWVGHVHSMPEVRGSKLWKFAHETAMWMVQKRRMTQLLCFVKDDNRPLKTFVTLFGMKEVGNVGDEVLYTASDQQILQFRSQKENKEVEQCQQH